MASDLEDLFEVDEYLGFFNDAYAKALGKPLKNSELGAGDRIVERIASALSNRGTTLKQAGGYNHYTVISHLAAHPPKAFAAPTLDRFEQLFAEANRFLE